MKSRERSPFESISFRYIEEVIKSQVHIHVLVSSANKSTECGSLCGQNPASPSSSVLWPCPHCGVCPALVIMLPSPVFALKLASVSRSHIQSNCTDMDMYEN